MNRITPTPLLATLLLLGGCAATANLDDQLPNGTQIELIPPIASLPDCRGKERGSARLPKRLLLTAFTLRAPNGSADLPDFERQFGRALQERLLESGQFLIRDARHRALSPRTLAPTGTDNFDNRSEVQAIATETDSQLVVGGEILDTHIQYASGFLGGITGTNTRHLSVRYDLYDGFSGLKLQSFVSGVALKDAEVNSIFPILQPAFYRTPVGQATDLLLGTLEKQSQIISSCLPLMGRIALRDNNEVVLTLGHESGIKKGDKFSIVHSVEFGFDAQSNSLFEQKPMAEFVVKNVQPTLTFGELVNRSANFRIDRNTLAIGW